MDAPAIPDFVVAYAAGLYDASNVEWPAVAGMLMALGLGEFRPDHLAAAATEWQRAHVAPEGREHLRRVQRRPWRKPTIETIALPRAPRKRPPRSR
jgi:hypothetical protein